MSEEKPLISLVFSFRNEEKILNALINRIAEVMDALPYPYEMIFVNDDSTDRSLDILTGLADQNERIKIINMSRRFGHGECYFAGFEHAAGEAIVYLAADLQDPPEVIPELIQKWEEGVDLVYTIRTERHGEPRAKMILTDFGYWFIRLFSEIDLRAQSSDFRLISRRAMDEVLKLKEHRPYVRGLTAWVGFDQAPVYYEAAPRFAGQSSVPNFSLFQFRDLMKGVVSYSDRLALYLAIAGPLALLLVLLSFILSMTYHFVVEPLSVWVFAFQFALFLWSTMVTAVGILSVYLAQVADEVRGRPRFIIKDKIGF